MLIQFTERFSTRFNARFKTRPAAPELTLAGAALAAFLSLPCAAFAQVAAVTNQPVNLMAGPGDDYPVVTGLGPNQQVEVMGCVDTYEWCDVALDDLRGWVDGNALTYFYEGNYVPVESYGAVIGLPVVVFSIDTYWDRYYHGRPWYGDRDRWRHGEPPHYPGAGGRPYEPPRGAEPYRPPEQGRPYGGAPYPPPVHGQEQPVYRPNAGPVPHGGPQPQLQPQQAPQYGGRPPVQAPRPQPQAQPQGRAQPNEGRREPQQQ